MAEKQQSICKCPCLDSEYELFPNESDVSSMDSDPYCLIKYKKYKDPAENIAEIVTARFNEAMYPPPPLETVTIKFTTEDDTIFTKDFLEDVLVEELRKDLMYIFGVPRAYIELTHCDTILKNENKLSDFIKMAPKLPIDYSRPSKGAPVLLELNIRSTNEGYKVLSSNAYKDLVVPDIITVTIKDDNGDVRYITVEIYNFSIVKPCLGGFVNMETGVQYYHGYSQTGPFYKSKLKTNEKTHRDTQTYNMRNRLLNTTYDRATQMSTQTIWIPNVNDKILKARKYKTAARVERERDILGKVRIIQRYFRAWKMRKALKVLHEEYWKRKRIEEEENDRLELEDQLRKKREMVAKIFPQSNMEFAMLYNMVAQWKQAETQRIQNSTCGPAKIVELYSLLLKEVQLLRGIEFQRQKVREDKLIQNEIDFFKTIGNPIEWNSKYKNLHIQMDTLQTQQGRFFKQMYLNIADKTLCRAGKLEGLLKVKLYLRGHACAVSNELVRLIERAMQLMARGISDEHLEGLMKRIQAYLIKHFKQPECSFDVTKRSDKERKLRMRDNLFYCERCHEVKKHEEYPLTQGTTGFRVCKKCLWDDKVSEPWVDLAPYRYILRCIRDFERKKSSHSSVAFILQDVDIHLLITKVWHSHSAINECNDIYQLRLSRWFRDEDWAPWNCILLTKEEMKSHLEVHNLTDVYDNEFLCQIYNRLSLSRKYYLSAYGYDCMYQETGKIDTKWNEIFPHIDYFPIGVPSFQVAPCH